MGEIEDLDGVGGLAGCRLGAGAAVVALEVLVIAAAPA